MTIELTPTAAATTALFRAFAAESRACIKTDHAIVEAGLSYAAAIDTGASTLLALMEEVASLPAAIKITETKDRKAAGLPTNTAMLVGLAHVGRMVDATSTDGEGREEFAVRRAWHLATQVYSIGTAHGGGVDALAATLTGVTAIEDAFDALSALYAAVNDARIAAKAAAKAAADAANAAANAGAEGSDDDGEGSGEGSLDIEPSSASRWASVLAVLAALAVAGLSDADTAAHAQATALLAGMASFEVPATIEGVFS